MNQTKIDFKKDVNLSFDQIKEKYGLTINQVMEQYIEYRASNA